MPLPDIGQMSYSRWLGRRVEKAELRSPGYATLEKERTFESQKEGLNGPRRVLFLIEKITLGGF
jgi:hypothetical protein